MVSPMKQEVRVVGPLEWIYVSVNAAGSVTPPARMTSSIVDLYREGDGGATVLINTPFFLVDQPRSMILRIFIHESLIE